MKVYIAGPISNIPNLNRAAFASAARKLIAAGHEPVNPLTLHADLNAPRTELLKRDIEVLLTCDAIYMLNGWRDSHGAALERLIAEAIGLEVVTI